MVPGKVGLETEVQVRVAWAMGVQARVAWVTAAAARVAWVMAATAALRRSWEQKSGQCFVGTPACDRWWQ